MTRVRLSEFWLRMRDHFGPGYAESVARDHVLAAGDHLNDLPMLSGEFARCLAAPDNAVGAVKDAVRRQNGYVSHQPWGHGVARGLEFFLEKDT